VPIALDSVPFKLRERKSSRVSDPPVHVMCDPLQASARPKRGHTVVLQPVVKLW